MKARTREIVSLVSLAIGVLLFVVTIYYFDFNLALARGRRFALAVLLALIATGITHLTRTWAWAWCFANRGAVPFWRLARIRLAAEAVSYLTISGVAGDALKVVMLGGRVSGREATAAVALERIAYTVGTALVVGMGAVLAIATQPLSPGWIKVYRAFAIGTGLLAAAIVLILVRRDSYLLQAIRAIDRKSGTHITSGKAGRLIGEIGRELGELLSGDSRRLVVLAVATLVVYACMAAEVWSILYAVGVPISMAGAVTVETFARVTSFATAPIPGSVGALEASSLAAAAAVGAGVAGGPLALARRLRGIFWAGLGLAIYPRGSKNPESTRNAAPGEERPNNAHSFSTLGRT